MFSEKAGSVLINSWGWSQIGNVSQTNQDHYLNWPDHFIWAVADGVGQSLNGEFASRQIIENLLQLDSQSYLELKVKAVYKSLFEANKLLWEKRSEDAICASTVTVLIMHTGKATCLWSGDSRCYMLRQGVLYQCTKDHTLRQEQIDQGLLSAPEARRMIKGHIITKAIGAQETINIESVDFSLEPGDRFLLCTDGFSGIIADEVISDVLRKSKDPHDASLRFNELVNVRWQPDNVTQITVFVSELAKI